MRPGKAPKTATTTTTTTTMRPGKAPKTTTTTTTTDAPATTAVGCNEDNDTCLQNREGWKSTDTCAYNAESGYCVGYKGSNSYGWATDLLACCPAACKASMLDTTKAQNKCSTSRSDLSVPEECIDPTVIGTDTSPCHDAGASPTMRPGKAPKTATTTTTTLGASEEATACTTKCVAQRRPGMRWQRPTAPRRARRAATTNE